MKFHILDLCNSILDLYRHPNVGDRSIDLIGQILEHSSSCRSIATTGHLNAHIKPIKNKYIYTKYMSMNKSSNYSKQIPNPSMSQLDTQIFLGVGFHSLQNRVAKKCSYPHLRLHKIEHPGNKNLCLKI